MKHSTGALDDQQLLATEGSKKSRQARHSTSTWTECEKRSQKEQPHRRHRHMTTHRTWTRTEPQDRSSPSRRKCMKFFQKPRPDTRARRNNSRFPGATTTLTSSMICCTERCRTLFWERTMSTSAETPQPPPALPTTQEPTLGLLNIAQDECWVNRSISCTDGECRGVGKAVDTRQPHPPGNNFQRNVTHQRTRHAAPLVSRLTPSFTSHVEQVSDMTGY